jgi:uncharacterized protein (DUF924 family)
MLALMVDEVLAFWFGERATTSEEFLRKIRRWFMGGPALDAEIRDRFASLVEQALAGELDDWSRTARGRLALILLLDQFTRSIYRDDPRMYAGDARAQALSTDALDRGMDRELPTEERHFLMMPLVHAEDLALQDRSVATVEALIADAPDCQQAALAMAIEQSRKYRDVIARFGRFPHRNAILGRTSTPEEQHFLADWEQKSRPQGTDKLPT